MSADWRPRHLLQGTAATALATTFPGRATFAKDTVVGFVYVGSRDDYGYNQAHAAGAAALKKMAGIKVVEEEKVPETDAVEKTMESMINLDGATLLFPTSFGYFSPHVLKLANKYPKARFEHAGGLWTEKDPKKNVGSYFGYIDEAQYVAGIVAGHSTKTGKLGFVAAKPIPQLLRNVNAFMLGARLANPNATLQVIFTGDWSMPVKEAEATNSLVDAGVDVITWRLAGPCTFALGHLETPLQRVGAIARRHHANPAEAHWRWRGRGASRSGSVSVNTMHALFKGEVECKMTAGSTGSELNSPTAMLFGLSRAQRLPKNHCRI